MKSDSRFQEKVKNTQLGRIRPFILALLIITVGLVLDKWWWQIGLVVMIVLFIEAYYRYRTTN